MCPTLKGSFLLTSLSFEFIIEKLPTNRLLLKRPGILDPAFGVDLPQSAEVPSETIIPRITPSASVWCKWSLRGGLTTE